MATVKVPQERLQLICLNIGDIRRELAAERDRRATAERQVAELQKQINELQDTLEVERAEDWDLANVVVGLVNKVRESVGRLEEAVLQDHYALHETHVSVSDRAVEAQEYLTAMENIFK